MVDGLSVREEPINKSLARRKLRSVARGKSSSDSDNSDLKQARMSSTPSASDSEAGPALDAAAQSRPGAGQTGIPEVPKWFKSHADVMVYIRRVEESIHKSSITDEQAALLCVNAAHAILLTPRGDTLAVEELVTRYIEHALNYGQFRQLYDRT